LSARAVTRVDRARSGLTTSRVTLILDSGADRPDLKVDASHDDIALLYRIALEMAGLPGTAPKRLLDGPGRALARRLDAISESGLGAPKTPASQRPSDGHDLLGCLARLLAANILTVEEFESKRRQLGS
jgi:hypothetical protein